jgi:glutamine amidotransferase-like uncharacterized protein
MSASGKVFIFNNQSISSESVADIGTFLRESSMIFANQPDIVEINTIGNTDGLENPTFVVPGGLALRMAGQLKPIFQKIRASTLGDNFNFIGICAGALLAPKIIEVYDRNYTYAGKMEGLNLIDEYQAIGTFCPLQRASLSKKACIPYFVSLSLAVIPTPSRQLFVSGCGFFAAKDQLGTATEVVATYTDRPQYEFAGENSQTVQKLPAMIRKKHHGNHGGVFLSGTHFEASVKESVMLAAFKKSTDKIEALGKTS